VAPPISQSSPISEEGQDRGLPRATHHAEVVGQHRKEFPLAVEAAVLGQKITSDQDKAGLVLLDYTHQAALRQALTNLAQLKTVF
jgi:hypothetical protein